MARPLAPGELDPNVRRCAWAGCMRPASSDDPYCRVHRVDEEPADAINPTHYQGAGGVQPIDLIEAFDLGFCLGNAVKYISRAGRKGDAVEDLKKARWYLDREIERRTKAKGNT